MEIKKITNNILTFIIKRFIEIFGFCISLLGLALLASLLTYSPEDPNFIFSENTEIKNILGYRGSFTSDFFFQSIGLISIIFAIGLFFNGVIILLSKKVFRFVENLFYSILYSITASLFFSTYYKNSFWLSTNGNGGFVGNFLESTFLSSIISLNKNFSYYILIIIIIILFLISINFKPKIFFSLLKKIIKLPFRKKEENLINKENDYDSENFNQQNENLIQENLPFVKKPNEIKNIKSKFVLPSIELLKAPLKNERKKNR